jgi:hypothetical protein
MEPARQIRRILAAGVRQRLCFFVPGLGATYFFWLAATLAHGGGRELGMLILVGFSASLGAATYILVIGAPGIMGSWKHWICGLLVAMILFVGIGCVLIPQRAEPSNAISVGGHK